VASRLGKKAPDDLLSGKAWQGTTILFSVSFTHTTW
jgi:hypothetical protein